MELQYDMVQVHLKDNLSYKWFTSKAGCVRGYAYIGKQFLEGETLLAYLSAATVREELVQKIVSLNGLYSFILHTNFGVVASSCLTRWARTRFLIGILMKTRSPYTGTVYLRQIRKRFLKEPIRFRQATICYWMPRAHTNTRILQ